MDCNLIKALREQQAQAGATWASDSDAPPLDFGNTEAAWQAALEGVALSDRTAWSLIAVRGGDRHAFLHNQTTNDIQALRPGTSCEAVFVNSTGRTLELATIVAFEQELLVLASPGQQPALLAWLDRYLFPMDRVELADASADWCCFSLLGPESAALLERLGIAAGELRPGQHAPWSVAGTTLHVLAGNGLGLPGYTLLATVAAAATVWPMLHQAGAVPLGDRVWQQLRVRQGRPAVGAELTLDYNPLEAGLWSSISFTKGCYIGQETIARLNTYKGVKQRLWGVQLSGPVEPGAAVLLAGEAVGRLTSAIATPEGWRGLAYVKTKAAGAGATVQVGEATGTLVGAPLLRHEYYEPEPSA